MLETNDAYLAELAQHIVTLADFWRRNRTTMKAGADLHITRTLIGTWLELDEACAEPIARLVIAELNALAEAGGCAGAGAADWKVEVVATVLRQNAGASKERLAFF